MSWSHGDAREQAWEDAVLRETLDEYMAHWTADRPSTLKRSQEESYVCRRNYVTLKRAGALDVYLGQYVAIGKNGLLAHGEDLASLIGQLAPLYRQGVYHGLYTIRVGERGSQPACLY